MWWFPVQRTNVVMMLWNTLGGRVKFRVGGMQYKICLRTMRQEYVSKPACRKTDEILFPCTSRVVAEIEARIDEAPGYAEFFRELVGQDRHFLFESPFGFGEPPCDEYGWHNTRNCDHVARFTQTGSAYPCPARNPLFG